MRCGRHLRTGHSVRKCKQRVVKEARKLNYTVVLSTPCDLRQSARPITSPLLIYLKLSFFLFKSPSKNYYFARMGIITNHSPILRLKENVLTYQLCSVAGLNIARRLRPGHLVCLRACKWASSATACSGSQSQSSIRPSFSNLPKPSSRLKD